MALERRNPLPTGLYWQDVFDKDIAAFQDWLKRNAATVIVRETEHFEPPLDGDPSRDFFLIEVKAPTKWEGPGFPTITKNPNLTSSDTAQRPDPEKPPDPEHLAKTALEVGAGLAVLYLVLQVIRTFRGN